MSNWLPQYPQCGNSDVRFQAQQKKLEIKNESSGFFGLQEGLINGYHQMDLNLKEIRLFANVPQLMINKSSRLLYAAAF